MNSRKGYRRIRRAWPAKARHKREQQLLFGNRRSVEMAFASRGIGGKRLTHLMMLCPSQRGLMSAQARLMRQMHERAINRIAVEQE